MLEYREFRQWKEQTIKGRGSFAEWFFLAVTVFAWVNATINAWNVPAYHDFWSIDIDPTPYSLILGYHVHPFYFAMYILVLAFITIQAHDHCFDITGWDTFASLPMKYLTMYGVIIVCAILALQKFDFVWAAGGYSALIALLSLFAVLYCVRRIGERIQAKAAAAAKKQKSQQSATIAKKLQPCTICKQESMYEVCLDCEKKYRGERHRVRAQNLRAKQAGVPATLKLQEWLETLETFHHLCAYCQSAPYQVLEHYIPINHGGGTTSENCLPACYSCNVKKSGKHPEK